MTDLDELMTMWSQDSKVDETKLGEEVIKTANLHSKYLNIMTKNRLKSKVQELNFNKEKIFKIKYYSGHFNNSEDMKMLEERGLEPIQEKILKNQIQSYLDSDQTLIDILLKKAMYDEIVAYCEEVLKALANRGYAINASIKWNIFTSGG